MGRNSAKPMNPRSSSRPVMSNTNFPAATATATLLPEEKNLLRSSNFTDGFEISSRSEEAPGAVPDSVTSETSYRYGPAIRQTVRMASVKIEIAPEEVGLSSQRLERLTDHVHRYVDSGKYAGTACLVARHGQIAYLDHYGLRDKERDLPVETDTIYRFFSMTKPATSIAAMQLYEQGRFGLSDPIERYIPGFANMKVLVGGSPTSPMLRPASTPMTIHSLLTHTSGLTYDFMNATAVDAMYRARGFATGARGRTTEEVVATLAELPLLCDPGTEWNYSMSTDVIGHLIEVLTDQPLDEYLSENVFDPLGMIDTGFSVATDARDRFSACYILNSLTGDTTLADAPETSRYLEKPAYLSGGGGLVSTMHDYHRFCLAMMQGGALDSERVIGSRTLRFMASNHLPGGQDMASCGTPLFSEATYEGVGFGLGFSVELDPAASKVLSSPGQFGWGGMASTTFFCDPVEDLHVIFLTQLVPSSAYPIRQELKALVHQALID